MKHSSVRPNRNLKCGRPAPFFPVLEEQKFAKWHLQLKQYLLAQKLKYSEQRWKIARLILEKRGHFSAQEIVKEVLDTYPGIGAATVYRNIKVLCDARILKETLVDAEGVIVYESYEEEHHDHIVCLDCNEIFEFHDPNIESLQDKIAAKLKFNQVRHRHIIYVRCQFNKKK